MHEHRTCHKIRTIEKQKQGCIKLQIQIFKVPVMLKTYIITTYINNNNDKT